MITVSYRKSVLRGIIGEQTLVQFLDDFILNADGVSAGL
jgi:hypothetical protein